MNDSFKNKKVLDFLGIVQVKGLVEISGEEPIYPKTVMHVWQREMMDEGLKRNDKIKDIAVNAQVSVSTVLRRKKEILGI